MKRLLILLIFLLLFSFALSANTGGNEQSFVVSAYKREASASPVYKLSIYDALSSDLQTVDNGADVNISNYVSKYLGTYVAGNSYSAIELGKRAAFSVHVDGNAPGSYTLEVSYGPLAPSSKDASTGVVTINPTENGNTTIIKATYLFSQYSVFFSASEAKTSEDGKQTIELVNNSPLNTAVTIDGEKTGTTTMNWKVEKVNGDETAEVGSSWQAHAMVALFIDKVSYDSAPNGKIYRAQITVTLKNE